MGSEFQSAERVKTPVRAASIFCKVNFVALPINYVIPPGAIKY